MPKINVLSVNYAYSVINSPESTPIMVSIAMETITEFAINLSTYHNEFLIIATMLFDIQNKIQKYLSGNTQGIVNFEQLKILKIILDIFSIAENIAAKTSKMNLLLKTMDYSYVKFIIANLYIGTDDVSVDCHKRCDLLNSTCFEQILTEKRILKSLNLEYPYNTNNILGDPITLGFSLDALYFMQTRALRHYNSLIISHISQILNASPTVEVYNLLAQAYQQHEICLQEAYEINPCKDFLHMAYSTYLELYSFIKNNQSRYISALPNIETIIQNMNRALELGIERGNNGIILISLKGHCSVTYPEFQFMKTQHAGKLNNKQFKQFSKLALTSEFKDDPCVQSVFSIDPTLKLIFLPLFKARFANERNCLAYSYAKIISSVYNLHIAESNNLDRTKIIEELGQEYKKFEKLLVNKQVDPAKIEALDLCYAYYIYERLFLCIFNYNLTVSSIDQPQILIEKMHAALQAGVQACHIGLILVRIYEAHQLHNSTSRHLRPLANDDYRILGSIVTSVKTELAQQQIQMCADFSEELHEFHIKFTSSFNKRFPGVTVNSAIAAIEAYTVQCELLTAEKNQEALKQIKYNLTATRNEEKMERIRIENAQKNICDLYVTEFNSREAINRSQLNLLSILKEQIKREEGLVTNKILNRLKKESKKLVLAESIARDESNNEASMYISAKLEINNLILTEYNARKDFVQEYCVGITQRTRQNNPYLFEQLPQLKFKPIL